MKRIVEQTSKCVNPGNNAGEIQKFLGISIDKTFGDGTAEAVATYLEIPNIKTRKDLFTHMVKDHPEFKGGIGPNAQKVIGDLLYAKCQQNEAAAQKAKEPYKPTLTKNMWGSMMRLWNHEPSLREELLSKVNAAVKKETDKFKFDETYCEEVPLGLTSPNVCIRLKLGINYVKLDRLQQYSDNWMKAYGSISGNANLVGIDSTTVYGDVEVLFKVEDGNICVKLDDIKVSSSRYYDFLVFEVKFQSNKIKIYNDFWCGGRCYSWKTPIKSEAIAAVGDKCYDIMPYIDKLNQIS